MKQKITIEVDIPDGYEATGEYRTPKKDEYFLTLSGTAHGPCMRDSEHSQRFILRKKFEWPSWLKAAAIARDIDGRWCAFASGSAIPDRGESRWHGGALIPIAKYIQLDLPDVPWEQSLIINPNRPTNET